jgi:Ca2+-binding EF-hand superfamily protein
MKLHRFTTGAAALLLMVPLLAIAQDASKADMAQKMSARFDEADADHDGKLTKAEAAKLPRISKNFDAIDKDGHGTITKADIASWYKTQQAAKKGSSGG